MTRRLIRSFAAVVAVGGILLAAGGCGSDPEGTAAPAASSSGGPGSSAAGFPVTVTHSLGKVTIPAAPKRVVALSSVDLDASLAAGVDPVLATRNFATQDGGYPWLKDVLDTKVTTLVNTTGGLPLEQIAAARPDLILDTGDYTAKDTYAKLSKIAPTLAPIGSAATDTWQARQDLIGRALGRQAASDAAVTRAKDAIAAAKSAHPGLAGKTFSVTYAAAADQIVTLCSPHDFAVQFLQSLGLTQAPALTKLARQNVTGVATVSRERLDLLSADLMVAAYQTPDLAKSIGQSQLMVSAGKGHTVQQVDLTTITLLRNPSTLGLPWILQALDGALAKVAGA